METIKEWALGITLISFSGGIMSILLPKGNTAKTVKSIISVLIILSCAAPFAKGQKFKQELFTENYFSADGDTGISRTINRQKLGFVEEKLVKEINKILNKYSADAVKISFDDNIDSEGGIVINQVKIYLDEKYQHIASKIHDDILSILGIESEVILSGDYN